ncbi:LysM peptidoglycan-binding domain-containing protein [Terriglobus roseus]|uniref:LysM domain-containing protein n=1 Tax=Terriglobus roseus TaxID=392734 RepID=A0A1H4IXF4_9BACT|nr:hypothetical protein [Terriglobus roseus]SEB38791.1 hypothetical protein SAMN05443244_0182 [Terriglobus roseus]
MDSALASMIQSAAGTGAPTNPSSRYYGAATQEYVGPDGVAVRYLSRRILPQIAVYSSTRTYTVQQGDRLDNLAAKFLGDPLLFWMIADANAATDAEALTEEPGIAIRIPLASNLPPGSRNG